MLDAASLQEAIEDAIYRPALDTKLGDDPGKADRLCLGRQEPKDAVLLALALDHRHRGVHHGVRFRL
jgi:hypothetical protein